MMFENKKSKWYRLLSAKQLTLTLKLSSTPRPGTFDCRVCNATSDRNSGSSPSFLRITDCLYVYTPGPSLIGRAQ